MSASLGTLPYPLSLLVRRKRKKESHNKLKIMKVTHGTTFVNLLDVLSDVQQCLPVMYHPKHTRLFSKTLF